MAQQLLSSRHCAGAMVRVDDSLNCQRAATRSNAEAFKAEAYSGAFANAWRRPEARVVGGELASILFGRAFGPAAGRA